MKNALCSLSLLASSAAMAGDYKLNLESRMDLTKNTNTTTAQAGTKTKTEYTSFKNVIVRLNLVGNISEELTYRFRYRFTKNETDTSRDGASNMLDYAYVDHKNAFFTARLGKQKWDEVYGRESFLSSSDVYISSVIKDALTNDIGEYRFGVSAIKKFMGSQSVALSISNPNKTLSATAGNAKNNSLAYGVTYNGSFMEKMLQPMASYLLAPQDADSEAAAATRSKKGNYTLWAAGLRSEVMGAVIDGDYKEYQKANRNDGINTSLPKEKTKSMYFNLAYAIDELTPFVSYINDKYSKENSAGSDYKKNTFAVGLGYRPYKETNFRYHAVYSQALQKFDSATATNKEVKDSNILLGIKADI